MYTIPVSERPLIMSQNCTTWEGGSLGNGDLTSFQVVAYVVATTTKPADPADVDSSIQEHDDFDFFGMDLSSAHSDNYSSYIGGSVATSTSIPTSTIATTSIASTTSAAPTAVQTEVSPLYFARASVDVLLRLVWPG